MEQQPKPQLEQPTDEKYDQPTEEKYTPQQQDLINILVEHYDYNIQDNFYFPKNTDLIIVEYYDDEDDTWIYDEIKFIIGDNDCYEETLYQNFFENAHDFLDDDDLEGKDIDELDNEELEGLVERYNDEYRDDILEQLHDNNEYELENPDDPKKDWVWFATFTYNI